MQIVCIAGFKTFSRAFADRLEDINREFYVQVYFPNIGRDDLITPNKRIYC